jgi:hypothetical protein
LCSTGNEACTVPEIAKNALFYRLFRRLSRSREIRQKIAKYLEKFRHRESIDSRASNALETAQSPLDASQPFGIAHHMPLMLNGKMQHKHPVSANRVQ